MISVNNNMGAGVTYLGDVNLLHLEIVEDVG
jgi:hypothetical protein